MSKGLSWRQHYVLASIARRERSEKGKPVAWRDIDYGPTSPDSDLWNTEQSLRRSLRSMERRGLVELNRYCFWPVADMPVGHMSPNIFWVYQDPDDYVPGEMRMMTGVVLTEAGRAVIAEYEQTNS